MAKPKGFWRKKYPDLDLPGLEDYTGDRDPNVPGVIRLKTDRRVWDEAYVDQCVAELQAGKITKQELMERQDISAQNLRRWIKPNPGQKRARRRTPTAASMSAKEREERVAHLHRKIGELVAELVVMELEPLKKEKK